jgi:hypothetical protein
MTTSSSRKRPLGSSSLPSSGVDDGPRRTSALPPQESFKDPALSSRAAVSAESSSNTLLTSYPADWNSRIIVAAVVIEETTPVTSRLRGDNYSSFDRQQEHPGYTIISEPPSIAHSCLLIPVGLVFWWYWTKRTARRLLRGMLPHSTTTACGSVPEDYQCHHPEGEDDNPNSTFACSATSPRSDQFQSWEDVVDQEPQDRKLRFVRWFKGKHYTARSRLKVISNQTIRHASSGKWQKDYHTREGGVNSVPILSEDEAEIKEETSSISSVSTLGKLPVHWQCIEDMTGFELCEMKPLGSSGSDDHLASEKVIERYRAEKENENNRALC